MDKSLTRFTHARHWRLLPSEGSAYRNKCDLFRWKESSRWLAAVAWQQDTKVLTVPYQSTSKRTRPECRPCHARVLSRRAPYWYLDITWAWASKGRATNMCQLRKLDWLMMKSFRRPINFQHCRWRTHLHKVSWDYNDPIQPRRAWSFLLHLLNLIGHTFNPSFHQIEPRHSPLRLLRDIRRAGKSNSAWFCFVVQ